MTWRPNEPAGETFVPTGARYIRENFQVIEFAIGADILNANQRFQIFPAGTRLWFYQDTAPEGWTIIADASDCLIACKSGDDQAIYSTGGQLLGNWQQSNHILTEGQMPRHGHNIPYFGECGSNPGNGVTFWNSTYLQGDRGTYTTGDDQPHNHGNTWRPFAAVGIICEKS